MRALNPLRHRQKHQNRSAEDYVAERAIAVVRRYPCRYEDFHSRGRELEEVEQDEMSAVCLSSLCDFQQHCGNHNETILRCGALGRSSRRRIYDATRGCIDFGDLWGGLERRVTLGM